MKILKTLALALLVNLIWMAVVNAEVRGVCREPFIMKLAKVCLWNRPMDLLDVQRKLKDREPLGETIQECRIVRHCELPGDASINYSFDLSDDPNSAYFEALNRMAQKQAQ